jgi:S1-C subfamily serine protease
MKLNYPKTTRGPIVVGVASLLLISCLAHADEIAEKGRAIFKQHQQEVVTVQIVIKSKVSMEGMSDQSSEAKQEVTGTVMDGSGLTVMALSATDPGAMIQGMLEGQDSRIKMETEVSDIKILLEDSTEVPAEIVLRDKDLDLAFIRPKAKPAQPMKAIDMSQAGKAEILDQVVTLNRLGTVTGRAYSAAVERISAIVQRPRLLYIPDSTMTTTTLGAPAFTLDGKPLGLFVLRAVKGKGASNPLSPQANNFASVILPVADIMKAASQAPAVAEPKKETADDKKDK